MSRFWRGVLIAAISGGLLAGGATTALAASPSGPAVTIAATSQFKPVTGDVFVVYHFGKDSKATISAAVSGAAAGDVVTLFAQRFPYTAAPKAVGSKTLTGATGSFSFSVTPVLATRYQAEVLAPGSPATVLATSGTDTVYVANLQEFSVQACARPVCTERLRVMEWVPARALKDEITKTWYFYFGLKLSATGRPKLPAWLTLDAHATISKARKVGALRFVRTITFSFRIGNDGYAWDINLCTKDTEAKDGLGLPGHHGCGAPRVRSTTEYLG
jgi:hypothetical protein